MKILVVENDPSVRRMLQIALNEMEHEVTCVSNAQMAIATFEIRQHEFDAIITCNTIFGNIETGIDVIKFVKKIAPEVHTVFMSAGMNDGLKQLAISAGADRTLSKPFGMEQLKESLKPRVG